jgi:hypothetical protein
MTIINGVSCSRQLNCRCSTKGQVRYSPPTSLPAHGISAHKLITPLERLEGASHFNVVEVCLRLS